MWRVKHVNENKCRYFWLNAHHSTTKSAPWTKLKKPCSCPQNILQGMTSDQFRRKCGKSIFKVTLIIIDASMACGGGRTTTLLVACHIYDHTNRHCSSFLLVPHDLECVKAFDLTVINVVMCCGADFYSYLMRIFNNISPDHVGTYEWTALIAGAVKHIQIWFESQGSNAFYRFIKGNCFIPRMFAKCHSAKGKG